MDDPPKKKFRSSSDAQLYEVDFVFWRPNDLTPEQFVEQLRPLFKKWVFQLEQGETTDEKDGLHYQGRGSLFKKRRIQELGSLVKDTPLRGIHFLPSSNNSLVQECFYAIKLDTRVKGPWSDQTWVPPAYVPRQFRGLEDRLYPWQQTILDSKDTFNDRIVNLIYDPHGCQGKSTIARLCSLHHRSLRLPCVGDAKQLLESACDILMAQKNREPKLCFVDLPRTLTLDPKKFGPFMIAIEEIKAGVVCDMRNSYKEWWFDSPQVWVTCNHLPNLNYMSSDRWRFHTIGNFKQLRPLTKSELSQMIQPDQN